MEQRQFIELMESKGSLNKETIPMLQDFVSRFPYCQTGHLLLAKCLHDQHNIHFDQQLKTAAVYAADRKILYDLIQQQNETFAEEPPVYKEEPVLKEDPVLKEVPVMNEVPVFREEPVLPVEQNIFREEEKPPAEIKHVEESVFAEAPAAVENIFNENFSPPEIKAAATGEKESAGIPEEPSVQEESLREWFSEAELSEEITQEEPPTPIVDPHEVIRRRLSEILGKADYTDSKKDYTDEKAPADSAGVQDKTIEATTEADIQQEIIPADASFDTEIRSEEEEIMAGQAGRIHDDIDRIGLEHVLEETILHSIEKLPVIKEIKEDFSRAETPQKEISADETHSFLGWLKIKSDPTFGKVEKVHSDEKIPAEISEDIAEEDEEEESRHPFASKEELISQFIATEPRIVPSKAEFYSPVNQAKKSITEHEDLVSETLGKIYFNQGNLVKARSSFEKLSLLHPEKSSYFAALIQEIDNLLNKQE